MLAIQYVLIQSQVHGVILKGKRSNVTVKELGTIEKARENHIHINERKKAEKLYTKFKTQVKRNEERSVCRILYEDELSQSVT